MTRQSANLRVSEVPPKGKHAAFAKRLKALRLALGFDVAVEFATYIGISKSALSNLESGNYDLSKDVARKIITKIPEVTIEYFWFGDPRGMDFDLRRKIEAHLKDD